LCRPSQKKGENAGDMFKRRQTSSHGPLLEKKGRKGQDIFEYVGRRGDDTLIFKRETGGKKGSPRVFIWKEEKKKRIRPVRKSGIGRKKKR